MRPKHNKGLVKYAKQLRNEMTKEERRLWYECLRRYPIRFSRQKIIGNYIADFYCAKAKLVVELDGSQHYTEENIIKDSERSAYFESLGIKVIRFGDNEVNQNFEGVCLRMDEEVKRRVIEEKG